MTLIIDEKPAPKQGYRIVPVVYMDTADMPTALVEAIHDGVNGMIENGFKDVNSIIMPPNMDIRIGFVYAPVGNSFYMGG